MTATVCVKCGHRICIVRRLSRDERLFQREMKAAVNASLSTATEAIVIVNPAIESDKGCHDYNGLAHHYSLYLFEARNKYVGFSQRMTSKVKKKALLYKKGTVVR